MDTAMFYTNVIENLSHPDQRYVGHTADLRQRLADHNAGKCSHTSKFVTWKVKIYVAFETIEQAQHFEQYLKSGSGHVFARRPSGVGSRFRTGVFSFHVSTSFGLQVISASVLKLQSHSASNEEFAGKIGRASCRERV